MNITDIILVTENHKGSETNSLMDLFDFIDFAEKESWLPLKELAEDMATLGITCEGKEKWMESCFAENTTLFARYCADEKQLEAFLQGGYNTGKEWKFDEQRCSEKCLDCLKTLGISMYQRLQQEYGEHGQMKKLGEYRSRRRKGILQRPVSLCLVEQKTRSEAVPAGVQLLRAGVHQFWE